MYLHTVAIQQYVRNLSKLIHALFVFMIFRAIFSITLVMLQIVIKHSASKAMKQPIADVNNLPGLQLVLQWHVLNKLLWFQPLCMMLRRLGSIMYIIVIVIGILICQCQSRGVDRVRNEGLIFLGPLNAIPKLQFLLLTDDLIVLPVSDHGCVQLTEHNELQRPQNVNDSCLGQREVCTDLEPACLPAVSAWHPGIPTNSTWHCPLSAVQSGTLYNGISRGGF